MKSKEMPRLRQILGDQIMSPSVKTILGQEMIPLREDGEECGGDAAMPLAVTRAASAFSRADSLA